MSNETKASIRAATKEYPKYVVMVHELKKNTLRGDTYWVLRQVREFHRRDFAETFAARFD